MQIVIPMSGFGERFRKAGYALPKPLIEVEGKPIIAHVIEMFPGENDFIFIVNEDHLKNPNYKMEETLRKYSKTGKIVSIAAHKLGPIHAVQMAEKYIDKSKPTIVNYCDFTCYWNWEKFKEFVKNCDCDGCLPAYKGFHPHSLGTTNYAYMKETNGWAEDIQEKQPWTSNRMEEYASSGTYYFKTAQLMFQSFADTRAQDLSLNGEFYVSLAYKVLMKSRFKVAVYPLQHFMQWGTPEDVHEYNRWSDLFKTLSEKGADALKAPQTEIDALLVPMAGLGKRFQDNGYKLTKPLIPVSAQPMVFQSIWNLPRAREQVFVLRTDMDGYSDICQRIQKKYQNSKIVAIDKVTEGQACTADLAAQALDQKLGSDHILFTACDAGLLYSDSKLASVLSAESPDLVVWGVRGHVQALQKPEMFGWLRVSSSGDVLGVSVKKPYDNPAQDPIVVGTFMFKNVEVFKKCYDSLLQRKGKVNGEYYLDSCVQDALALGFKVKFFEVDHYMSWGTPNELKTFEYWQSCFSKWDVHPYQLERDPMVPPNEVGPLQHLYRAWTPTQPGELA